MENQTPETKRPNRPPPERRTLPIGSNFVWYLLGLGAVTLFIVSRLGTDNQVNIQYMDLWKLIEKGSPETNPQAAIEVHEGPKDKESVYRYSQLDNIRIGPNEITGPVTREIIKPESQGGKPEAEVAFHTPRLGLENDNNALFQLLEEKGFSNVQAEKAPSGWHSLMPMFIFTLLITAIIFF